MRVAPSILLPSTAIVAGATLALQAAGTSIPATVATGALGFLAGQVVGLLRDLRARSSDQRDELTGLLTREAAFSRLSEWRANNVSYALLLLDLDHFKPINDVNGHTTGDAVLRELGRRIGARVRDTDVAARLGGDEFLVALHDVSDRWVGRWVRSEIESVIEEPLFYDGRFFRVGASVGLAMVPDDATDVAAAMKIADERMYRRKRLSKSANAVGRSTVVIADPNPASRRALATCFGDGYLVIETGDVETALASASLNRCEIVIASDDLPNRGALQLLTACRELDPRARRILVTGNTDLPTSDSARAAGIYAVVPREFAETVLPALSDATPPPATPQLCIA